MSKSKTLEPVPVKETGCCPIFHPKLWDEKEIEWKGKLFVKDSVRSFLYMPIGMGKVMSKNIAKIEKAKAEPDEQLILSDCLSPWRSDLFISASKEVPEAEMVEFSGTYLTKVFEGPFKDMGEWSKEMRNYVKSKSKELKKLYFCYTTCPACAKAYGKNYIILFAEV